MSHWTGFQVIDVSDPRHPRIKGTNATMAPWPWNLEIEAAGGAALVAVEDRIAIFDTFNPWNPVVIASIQKGWSSPRTAAADGYAYVADGRRLMVLDVVDSTWPSPTGSLELPESVSAVGVGVPGETVLVSGGPTLSIVDVIDPTRPRVVGDLEHGDERVNAIEVSGHLAYLTGRSLLQVVDISDTAAPTLVGFVESEPCGDVVVRGGHAYLACSHYNGTVAEGSLVIVDVSDPTSPVEVGRYEQAGAGSLGLTGDLAFVHYSWWGCFNQGSGLLVIDISDPTEPSLVTVLPDPNWDYGWGELTIMGRFAVDVSHDALRVLDSSVPADIVEAGTVQLADWPHNYTRDLTAANGLAYVTVSNHGLIVVDPISTCEAPRRPAGVVAP